MTLARGVIEHRARIDELLAHVLAGLDAGPDARGRPRHPADGGWELLYATTSRTRSPSTRPSSWPLLSTDESPAFVNGLLARILEVHPARPD